MKLYVSVFLMIAAFLAYALLKNRLIAFVQPVRLRCAEWGEELLADVNLSDDLRRKVEFSLDNAYAGYTPIFIALMLPFVIILTVFDKPAPTPVLDDNIRQKTFRVVFGLYLSHVLSSPFAAICIVVELFAWVILSAIFGQGVSAFRVLVERAEKLEQLFAIRMAGVLGSLRGKVVRLAH